MNKKESKQVKRLILIIVFSVFLIFTGLAIELISAAIKHSKNTENSDNSQSTGFATESVAQVESVTEEESPYPMYIDSKDMITSQVLDAMKAQGEDAIRADIAQWGNKDEEWVADNKLYCQIKTSSPDIEYVGYYFQHAKDSDEYGKKNSIYLIYKVEEELNHIWTERGSENRDDWKVYSGISSYYTYVYFEQIQLVDSETATVDVTNYKLPNRAEYAIPYDTGIENAFGVDLQNWAYCGFKDFMTFENKCIVPEMDKYAYETELDESKFIKNEDLGVVEKDHTDYLNSVQFER